MKTREHQLSTLPASRQWKVLSFGLALSLLAAVAQAQPVAKAVLVEHFTNTRCSICASRNPSFYANLRQQPGVLHIAYHPSSPYRACLFSQQNVSENDARTNFYGVYGSTPRLALNGAVLPATADYAAPTLYAPYQGQTSPFAVAVSLRPAGADSITATVRLTTRAAHSYTGLTLYVALVQDTIFYAAPNGEQQHYDVFRQSFTGPNVLGLVPATAVGGVVTVTRTLYKNPIWTANRLYAMAIVQDAALQVVQAGVSAHFSSVVSGVRGATAGPVLRAYPNPASETLVLEADAELHGATVLIYNSLGQVVRQEQLEVAGLDVSRLAAGAYWLRLTTQGGQRYTARFVKAE